jgi:hypothetical protein
MKPLFLMLVFLSVFLFSLPRFIPKNVSSPVSPDAVMKRTYEQYLVASLKNISIKTIQENFGNSEVPVKKFTSSDGRYSFSYPVDMYVAQISVDKNLYVYDMTSVLISANPGDHLLIDGQRECIRANPDRGEGGGCGVSQYGNYLTMDITSFPTDDDLFKNTSYTDYPGISILDNEAYLRENSLIGEAETLFNYNGTIKYSIKITALNKVPHQMVIYGKSSALNDNYKITLAEIFKTFKVLK